MTGRDLIIYILQNNLEDAPVFEDGRFLGFITEQEAAIKFNVGVATIRTWVELGMMNGIKIGEMLYIPASEIPVVCEDKGVKNEKKDNSIISRSIHGGNDDTSVYSVK